MVGAVIGFVTDGAERRGCNTEPCRVVEQSGVTWNIQTEDKLSLLTRTTRCVGLTDQFMFYCLRLQVHANRILAQKKKKKKKPSC